MKVLVSSTGRMKMRIIKKKKIVTFMMTSNEPRLKNVTAGLSYYSSVGLCSRLSILLRFLLWLSIPAQSHICCPCSIDAAPALYIAPVVIYAALFLYPDQFYLTVMLLRLLYVLLLLGRCCSGCYVLLRLLYMLCGEWSVWLSRWSRENSMSLTNPWLT